MTREKNTSSKDDFWNLDTLLPTRKKASVSASEWDTVAVEIRQSAPTLKGAAFTESLFVEHPVMPYRAQERKHETASYTYRPQNTLLREVRVYPWSTEYDYYEQFARHARQLREKEGRECPETWPTCS